MRYFRLSTGGMSERGSFSQMTGMRSGYFFADSAASASLVHRVVLLVRERVRRHGLLFYGCEHTGVGYNAGQRAK